MKGAESRNNRLLWWVALAFLVQLCGWGLFLTIANKHKVEEIPLQRSAPAP
jgi:hypothetical protein